jgi:hypothetical protein
MSISNGKLVFDGGIMVWGDPIILYLEQHRSAKILYVWQVSPSGETNTSFEVGLINNLTTLSVAHSVYFNQGTIEAVNNNSEAYNLGAYTAGNNY